MPDVLTHVLVGYSLATLLSLHDDRLGPPFATVVMLGALLPNFIKIKLLIPSPVVEQALGLPFSCFAIHTPFGSVLIATMGALSSRQRTSDASSHSSYPLLWPLSTYHFPTPGLYLSSDRWPATVAALVTMVTWLVGRRRSPTD